MSDARLEARVRAVNNANSYANKLWPILAEQFRPFVGQKVLKADDSLMEKYKKYIPDFPCSPKMMVYRNPSKYSLCWVVKTCESDNPQGSGHAYYHETSVYVGELRDGVLIKVGETPPEFKSDYVAQDIIAKRQAYQAAKKIADDAFSALYPFGEYDR